MIIGMIPMALGMGEGGEQNAPLGRAVIGGLLLATVATLMFVPAVFGMFHGRRGAAHRDVPSKTRGERLRIICMEHYDDTEQEERTRNPIRTYSAR